MRLKEFLEKIDILCPFALQEDWDNSGLQVGDPDATVDRALLAFDFSEEVLAEAVTKNAQLIISHHPFFFQGLKRVDLTTAKGHMLAGLLKHEIALVSCHTSLDKVSYGVSAVLGNQLGLKETAILLPEGEHVGFGVIGSLAKEMTLEDFIATVKNNLHLEAVRFTGDVKALVRRVAALGGAGAEFMAAAKEQGADVYVSADFKYHDAQAAAELGLPIIDGGHFGTEAAVMAAFGEKLAAAIPEISFLLSSEATDFWSYR